MPGPWAKLNHVSKPQLSYFLLEVVFIFLSVFLAFTLGQWREAANNRRTAEIALDNIVREIESNRDEVQEILAFHEQMITSMRTQLNSSMAGRSAFERILIALDYSNPRMPLIEHSAWNTAVTSGAVQYMDYEILGDISALYNAQEKGLDSHLEYMLEFMLDPGMFDPEQADEHYMAMLMFMQSIHGNEIGFCANCDSLLAVLSDH